MQKLIKRATNARPLLWASVLFAPILGSMGGISHAQGLTLPQEKPSVALTAQLSVTPAPIELAPGSIEQLIDEHVIDKHTAAPGSFPAQLRILPRTKPGLPPLSRTVQSTAPSAPATTKPAPSVSTRKDLPKVARTGNDITPLRGTLKQALDALNKNEQKKALGIHKGMKASLDRTLLTYILAIGGYHDLPAAEIKAFYDRKTGWPSRSLIAKRVEEAVARQTPSGRPMVQAFGNAVPKSTTAAIELALSQAKVGNKQQAAKIIRPIWREQTLTTKLESRILSGLGSVLRREDHFHRASYLLYRERANGALRLKRHLSSGQKKLVDARVAVIRKQKNAGSKLKAVPSSLRKDPGFVFSTIQYLRRSGQETKAADALIKAPRDVAHLINHREWWIERRLLSRMMLNKGDPRRAYKIAAGHTAQSSKDRSEAEFHAGFFALRFLKDYKTAAVHFERSWQKASRSRDKARGLYWQGRSWEAAGNRTTALKFYNAAANPTVYYGQLALEELGRKSLALKHPPAASAALKAQFESRELVKAVKRLQQVGHAKRAGPILRHLARILTNPSEIALAHQMAQSYKLHQNAVQIGKIALARGMPAEKMAFPLNIIPRGSKTHGIDIALIYALTKQESVFDIGAISSANARGLMQMLPSTAKITARKVGVRYNKAKLTRDPKYAVNLGSYYLKENLERFGGSYILTFAAYNAGPGRPPQWVERFGDPRSRRISAIDWVERIPFTETRDYVMKLMENLQVYEARIHDRRLDISKGSQAGPVIVDQCLGRCRKTRLEPSGCLIDEHWHGRHTNMDYDVKRFEITASDGLVLRGEVFGDRLAKATPVLCLPGLTRNSPGFLSAGRAPEHRPGQSPFCHGSQQPGARPLRL